MDILDQEKLFYERFAALHNNPNLLSVFKSYGIAAFRRSSVLEGFEKFCWQHKFRGTCCVEIGTLKGLTAVILSQFFEQVVSVDVVNDPQKYEILELLGIKNVLYLNVADNAEKSRTIQGLTFDAAYSDGDHTNDAAADFALVERCGLVLMHEHWGAQPAVQALVARLGRGVVVADGKLALWRFASLSNSKKEDV